MNAEKKLLVAKSQILHTQELFPIEKTALLWSGGRDSTVLISIVRSMRKTKRLKIYFADSGFEFPEVYKYIDAMVRKWKLHIHIVKYLSDKTRAMVKEKAQKAALKKMFQDDYFLLLRHLQDKGGIRIFFSGVRWYEHYHRSDAFTETLRGISFAYPLLHWTERDVTAFMKKENIPVLSLYDQGYKHIENAIFSIKHTNL